MIEMNIFSHSLKALSELVGADEAALTLLVSILLGYPIAIIYRQYFCGRDQYFQHLYFIASGLLLGYLNYGLDVAHPLLSMVVTYVILAGLGATAAAVGAVFAFNMIYLLIGYYTTSTEYYDINWTMPHCVLVLRLIGIAFDYFDGQQKEDTLGADNKRFMLKTLPNPLEFFGFAFFPSSFLVGPQFPMRRYQNFVNGDFGDKTDPFKPPRSEYAALKRFGLGVFYLSVFQIMGMYVSDSYMVSEDFRELSFIRKHLILGLWGRFTLYKYISCWLLTEGSCILFGITYDGIDEKGEKQWNGLENVKLSIFENTLDFDDYVHSFNTNTNLWLGHYIYKRLKFLGNRNFSHLGALMFLAVWHGFHTGYFVAFFIEFLVIYTERDIKTIVKSNEKVSQFFNQPMVNIPLKLFLRLYTFIFMGFCLIPFVLFTWENYTYTYVSINYSGLILYVLYPVLWGPILRAVLKRKKTD
ncbi:hypothetical protein WA026_005255 [Henosepilachna vigintioctopunctata]|uniref:Lysophospholipid acyltransferase 5 n=1 Tax=Henosepilachna vigintioctopunctata TaxID=420089 RepID=A0AAW1UNF4_9CUCU